MTMPFTALSQSNNACTLRSQHFGATVQDAGTVRWTEASMQSKSIAEREFNAMNTQCTHFVYAGALQYCYAV